MTHLERFKTETRLIEEYGEEKSHLVSSIGLYLDHHDLSQLASEGLTDGNGDRKIDFIRLEDGRLIIAQGAFSKNGAFYKAKSNKAADLNIAVAWIFSGEIDQITEDETERTSLKAIIENIRTALSRDEIENIDLLYVHNLAESHNVREELETAKLHLTSLLKNLNNSNIEIKGLELGAENIEKLFIRKEAAIAVMDKIEIQETIKLKEKGEKWKAAL